MAAKALHEHLRLRSGLHAHEISNDDVERGGQESEEDLSCLYLSLRPHGALRAMVAKTPVSTRSIHGFAFTNSLRLGSISCRAPKVVQPEAKAPKGS